MLPPINIMACDIVIPTGAIEPLLELIRNDRRSEDMRIKVLSVFPAGMIPRLREIIESANVQASIITGIEDVRIVLNRRTFGCARWTQYLIEDILKAAKDNSWCEWALCESDVRHRWSSRNGRVIDQVATLTWSEPNPLMLDDEQEV